MPYMLPEILERLELISDQSQIAGEPLALGNSDGARHLMNRVDEGIYDLLNYEHDTYPPSELQMKSAVRGDEWHVNSVGSRNSSPKYKILVAVVGSLFLIWFGVKAAIEASN